MSEVKTVALFTALVFASASVAHAQLPKPKPKADPPKRSTPEKRVTGTLLISADLACALSIDGTAVDPLDADSVRKIELSPGQHLLVATTSNGVRWDGVADIKTSAQEVVVIHLREKSGASGGPTPPPPPIRLPAGAKLLPVAPGRFQMGCVPNDRACAADERAHPVQLTKTFWMLATEVTVAQFRAFAADTRSVVPTQPSWSGSQHPVVNVTWDDANAYCTWMRGRLPTEAEWEFAARLNSLTDAWPTGPRFAPGVANAEKSSGTDRWDHSSPVGSFPPTGPGFFDLAGNVWEWTANWYERDPPAQLTTDPVGPASGLLRSVRGGAWSTPPDSLRSSKREGFTPTLRYEDVGFRCVTDRPS